MICMYRWPDLHIRVGPHFHRSRCTTGAEEALTKLRAVCVSVDES